jgi:hypothetical protein
MRFVLMRIWRLLTKPAAAHPNGRVARRYEFPSQGPDLALAGGAESDRAMAVAGIEGIERPPARDRTRVVRPVEQAGLGCRAHGAQARARCRHHGADRQPLIPGDRDHGLSGQWRVAGARAIDGGA